MSMSYTPRRRTRLTAWRIHRVIGYIESNLTSPIRTDDLARQAHLSGSHFSRAFKSTLGASPQQYITRRRIELASELMRGSDQALAQIAVTCGWSDQPHFTKVFRRIVGMSPHAWRCATRPLPEVRLLTKAAARGGILGPMQELATKG